MDRSLPRVSVRPIDFVEVVEVSLFAGEQLHDFDAGDAFLNDRINVRNLHPHLAERFADPETKYERRHHEDRYDRKGREG